MTSMRTLIFATIFLGSITGCTERKLHVTTPNMIWPSLSEFSAVTNRPATEADVAEGRAVFVVQDGRGQPIDLALPQYAYHLDAESGSKVPCILIQAEQAQGQKLAGARMLPDRSIFAGFFGEFELLGSIPPSPPTQ